MWDRRHTLRLPCFISSATAMLSWVDRNLWGICGIRHRERESAPVEHKWNTSHSINFILCCSANAKSEKKSWLLFAESTRCRFSIDFVFVFGVCQWVFITLHTFYGQDNYGKQAAPICGQSKERQVGEKIKLTSKSESIFANAAPQKTLCTLLESRSALIPFSASALSSLFSPDACPALSCPARVNALKMQIQPRGRARATVMCKFRLVNLWLWHLVKRGKM